MAGTFWWAFETRSDMKAAADNHGWGRAMPAKFTGRRPKDERFGKFDPNKSQSGTQVTPPATPVRNDDDAASDRSAPSSLLAVFPSSPVPNPAAASPAPFLPASMRSNPASPNPVSSQPTSTGLGSSGLGSSGSAQQHPIVSSTGADMPLPALPVLSQPEPAAPQWRTSEPDPPLILPQLPPPAPVQNPKRPATREATRHPPPARPPKPPAAAPSYYTEKYLEGGEYHTRRRLCEPPNMPDVCFMPQADRQPVLVKP
jgi:hypothetical protein